MNDIAASPANRKQFLYKRSAVAPESNYRAYQQNLRVDFRCSCGYCFITEAEAGGIGFEIDHYVPLAKDRSLANNYDNLIYSCSYCNRRKSNIFPTAEMIAKGIRYLRPDVDYVLDHYKCDAVFLKHSTEAGEFTIEFLELNRNSLLRLRSLRTKLNHTIEHVAAGLAALHELKLDSLPSHLRSIAQRRIRDAQLVGRSLEEAIESALIEYASSPYLDEDNEKPARDASRKDYARVLEGFHPGFTGSARNAVGRRRKPTG